MSGLSEGEDIRALLAKFDAEIEAKLSKRSFHPKTIERRDVIVPPSWKEDYQNFCLPYTNFGGWVYEREIYAEAQRYLPISRLGRVRSLSYQVFPGPDREVHRFFEFCQNRLVHTLFVGKISEYILWESGCPEEEVKKGVVAALLHDVATPAFGNAVMELDYQRLNEEDAWQEMVKSDESQEFFRRHELKIEDLDQVIHNRGYLGKVLDVADRIAYVDYDTYSLLGLAGENPGKHVNDPLLGNFYRLLADDPGLFNIYQEVHISAGKDVFFDNPQRLGRFLKLRAMLTQQIYLHPLNQARDSLLAELVRPFYSPLDCSLDNKLTPDNLRWLSDEQLRNFLNSQYFGENNRAGYINFSFIETNTWAPEHQRFSSIEEAEDFKIEIENDPNMVVLGVKTIKGFNTGVSYLVKDLEGKYYPYYQVDPCSAAEIGEIEKSTRGIFVLFTDLQEQSHINGILRRLKELKEKALV